MTQYDETTTTKDDSVLGYLQELMLMAVMLGERLPGTRRPLRLLAGGRLLRDIPSRIIQSNLAQSIRLDDLPRQLEPLSIDQLKTQEQILVDEEFSFLAFRAPVWQADRVELSMVIGGVDQEDGSWRCREIGHVDTAFHEISGRWAAISEPHIYLAPEH
jgi:hypothetical protein